MPKEPEKKKAKRVAEKPSIRAEDNYKNACQRMADEYEEYAEKFEGWSRNKSHSLDEKEISSLHDNIKRLVEERDRVWNENREIFQKRNELLSHEADV